MSSNKGIDIVAVDRDWQFPAITEKHAFHKVKELVPYCKRVAYFAFPWATLIDLLDHAKPGAKALLDELDASAQRLKNYETVITVCQHIRMLQRQDLFKKAGVSLVFWSHAVKGGVNFNKHPEIKIKPFPLYAAQTLNRTIDILDRKHLFSFVGARSNQWYLTDSRNLILDHLSECSEGKIVGRDKWHYNDVVYKHQVLGCEHSSEQKAQEERNKQEYLDVMNETVFALCPSGSGPNSIRLWESIEMGIVPVILADTYLPPGDSELWQEAAEFCGENEYEIKSLPEILRKKYDTEGYLENKSNYINQLKMKYGKKTFVTDIVSEVFNLSQGIEDNFLVDLYANALNTDGQRGEELSKLFIISLSSGLLINTPHTLRFWHGCPSNGLKKLVKKANSKVLETQMNRIITLRKFEK